MVVDVFIVAGSEIEDRWNAGSVDSQIFSKSVEKSITVVLVRKGKDNSLGVGFIEGSKSLLGGL